MLRARLIGLSERALRNALIRAAPFAFVIIARVLLIENST